MGMNSMRQHREKMLAEKALKAQQSPDPRQKQNVPADLAATAAQAIQAGAEALAGVPNVELRMFNHLNILKDMKSIQDRIAKKAEWLPEYLGYIDGCLAVSPAPQNTTLVHLMIWACDVNDFELAVHIAEYVVLNDMVMPEGYTRSTAEFVTEQCAEVFIDDTDLAIANASLIERIINLGDGEQMVDEVRAKIYRALGDALNQAQPMEAVSAYKNALRYNPKKAGCKKDLEQLEKRLRLTATESSPDATVGSQAVSTANQTADGTDPASTDAKPKE
ncbi:phage terminase small subunit [uncultured Acinetobacter sp.]|uniref:phage terminase small subunit n=1 Tax=uncultured Acinetobacter sp. TaxID=165433 RepID=UPI002590E6CA|nr:phage terminase small subunit [uncultured Acinetobacter sp.]